MPTSRLIPIALLIVIAACQPQGGSGAVSAGQDDETGLQGIMLRGPITPVCMVNVPCDGPLSARFVVEQGEAEIAHFESDASGNFRVALAPGAYTVVPDESAPLMSPQSQRREVEVESTGFTTVTLSFDTGIR